MSYSIVEWFPPENADGTPDGHGCGYCNDKQSKKSHKGSMSHGTWAHRLGTDAYQQMIDRGWRRSGSYCYKPLMSKTCCPQYTIRQPCQQFKISKSQRKVLRNMSKRLNVDTDGMDWKEMINTHLKSDRLKIKLVKIGSEEFLKTKDISHGIYKKYQVEIHKDPPGDITMRQYERFLCSPPSGFENDENPQHAAYHQQYWFDGNLVAVGVVDWLTHCYSSVYLYYDPEYSEMSLGVYTALNEIKFCLDNSIQYYYLGYYVHGCPKMKYKSGYKPAELLCPVTLTWVALDERVLKLLEENKFSRLSDNTDHKPFMDEAVDSNRALLLHKRQPIPRGLVSGDGPEQFDLLCKLFGKELREEHILVYHN